MAESHVQYTDIAERFEHIYATLSSNTLLPHASPLFTSLAFAVRRHERSLVDAATSIVQFQLERQRAASTIAASGAVEARGDERDYDKVASRTLQVDVVRV